MTLARSHLVWVGIMINMVCYCGSVTSYSKGGVSRVNPASGQKIAACDEDPGQLIPCYPAALGSERDPSSACCSVLHDLAFQTDLGYRCLCDAMHHLPTVIDKTTMLNLTEACGVSGVKCDDIDPDLPAQGVIFPTQDMMSSLH